MEKKEQLKQLLSNANALLDAMRLSVTAATGAHGNVVNFAGAHIAVANRR
jgi:hypothetical protein